LRGRGTVAYFAAPPAVPPPAGPVLSNPRVLPPPAGFRRSFWLPAPLLLPMAQLNGRTRLQTCPPVLGAVLFLPVAPLVVSDKTTTCIF